MRSSTEAEFSEFARVAWPQLFRTAVVMVGDRQLAEDLVQSALVRAYVAWPRVRTSDRRQAYVRRVLVNVTNDWFRRRSSTHEQVGVSAPLEHDEPAAGDHVSELVDRADLGDALRALPPGQRSVVALRFLEDLSVEETADLLNVSRGTVKSQTSAALSALRRHVESAHERFTP